jgi:hypothetical protein
LAAGKKLRLLFQNSLQKGNRIPEIPQLNRRHRLQPVRALIFAQFFLSLNRHIALP